jgi:ATP-dependent helicase HrpA
MYQPASSQVGFTRADPHGGKASLPELWAHAAADIRDQLAHLMYTGFLVGTPSEWLVHYPRYLSAIRMRLQKLQTNGPTRDAKAIAEVEPLWREWQNRSARARQMGITDPALDQARWMIEELRVSLFAQELRTSIQVSAKRVAEMMSRVRVV